MQTALAIEDEEPRRQPRPELVTAAAAPPPAPEQIPLLRILEVVRDRVESLHASHRTMTAELRDIRANLPVQRRPLSDRTQNIHVLATWAPGPYILLDMTQAYVSSIHD